MFRLTQSLLVLGIAVAAAGSDKAPTGLSASDWSSIRSEYERNRHSVQRVGNEYHAPNARQQWLTRFDERGFVLQPNTSGWRWGLELKSYGFSGHEHGVKAPAQVTSKKEQITYRWDSTIEEWFVNDHRGLEHGFTLRQRPEGTGEHLVVRMAVRGGLRPQVQPGGLGVTFQDAAGQAVLQYAGLKVWDADGKVLPAQMATDGDDLRVQVDDSGSRYPITIDPLVQQAYLKASNTGNSDQFGTSVAISGDTVVVGANTEDSSSTGVNGNQNDNGASNAGAVYVFVQNSGVWTQQAYLKASNAGMFDQFGFSVAISGDTVVVGATEEDSSSTGVNSTPNDSAGQAGAAYVFVRKSGVWTQQAYLKASNAGSQDFFGTSVAISGDTVVVGATGESSSTTGINSTPDEGAAASGAAYVFVRNSGVWTQQAYLKASNTGVLDGFGASVAIAGDTVVVGAAGEDSSTTGVNSRPNEGATESGAAYVFVRNSGVWTEQAYLKASNSGASDGFGFPVAVYGDTVVAGATGEDSSTTGVNTRPDEAAADSGAAYVFARNSGVWAEQSYLKAANTGATDYFGWSVATSGDTVVVGAILEDSSTTGVNSTPDKAAADSGAAYIFARNSGVWTQQTYLKASNTGSGDQFGRSVAISGDTVVVSASSEDSNATGVNGDQSNNSASGSGALYVFAAPAPACPAAKLTLSPNKLTPPDHQLVEVTASLQIPSCVSSPQVKLVSIKSSEKDAGEGPGDVPNDIQQALYGTNDRKFLLRAEVFNRPAPNIITNKKRTYTVTYEVKDLSGNKDTVAGTVTVP